MRSARSILVLPLVAVALASCGGTQGVSVEAVAQAAEKTTDARTSRLSFTTVFRADGESVELHADGTMDYQRNVGRMTMDLGDLSDSAGSSFWNGKVEMIFDGLVYYMRLPPELARELGATKPWLKMDVRKIGKSAGLDLGSLAQVQQNPAELMQFLRAVGQDVEKVGEEEVRGIDTTRFRTTIEPAKAAAYGAATANVSPELRRALRNRLDELRKKGKLDDIPVDVWLDADGLVRKLVMHYDDEAEGARVRSTVTMELFDFGIDVRVRNPPAREVIDIAQFAQGGS